MKYAIVNESSAPELTPTILATIALDMQSAYDTKFAPAWGALPVDIVVASADAIPSDARVLHLVDSIPDAPGALAYHTVDDAGRPVLRLGVAENRSEGGVLLDVLSESMSHEVFETARNPFVNRYVEGPWSGKKVADEVGDPVQGVPFREGASAIADFTLPAWSDAGDTSGPYDYQGKLTAPFTKLPTGYLAFDDGSQDFGDRVSAARRTTAAIFGRTSLKAAS